MLAQLSRNWWLFALRGVIAFAFGILAFVWPNVTILFLVLLFGAYAFADGLLALVAALTNHAGARRGWVLLEGLVGIAIGIITLVWPKVTEYTLLYLIAFWAVLTGALEILAAVELRREITNEWWLILSGVISVIFGIAVFLFPGAGALGLLWLIALYAIVFGALVLVLSLRVRNLAK